MGLDVSVFGIDTCRPAVIFAVFGLLTALQDFAVLRPTRGFVRLLWTFIFTLGLNLLCAGQMNWLSWMLVLLPFIFLTAVTMFTLFMILANAEAEEEADIPVLPPVPEDPMNGVASHVIRVLGAAKI